MLLRRYRKHCNLHTIRVIFIYWTVHNHWFFYQPCLHNLDYIMRCCFVYSCVSLIDLTITRFSYRWHIWPPAPLIRIRPRRGRRPPSPTTALGTRHGWSAEWETGGETFALAHRRQRLPQLRAATSSQSLRWWGQSNCCHQGSCRWQTWHQGPKGMSTKGA